MYEQYTCTNILERTQHKGEIAEKGNSNNTQERAPHEWQKDGSMVGRSWMTQSYSVGPFFIGPLPQTTKIIKFSPMTFHIVKMGSPRQHASIAIKILLMKTMRKFIQVGNGAALGIPIPILCNMNTRISQSYWYFFPVTDFLAERQCGSVLLREVNV